MEVNAGHSCERRAQLRPQKTEHTRNMNHLLRKLTCLGPRGYLGTTGNAERLGQHRIFEFHIRSKSSWFLDVELQKLMFFLLIFAFTFVHFSISLFLPFQMTLFTLWQHVSGEFNFLLVLQALSANSLHHCTESQRRD